MDDRVAEAFDAGRAIVVGIGLDGWSGLSEASREALRGAGLVAGSPRQLDLLPTEVGGRRLAWGSGDTTSVPALVDAHASDRLAILASGDPLFFGIGRSLVDQLGIDRLLILPHASSVSLACARLGWPPEDVVVVGGMPPEAADLAAVLHHGRRLLVLSSGRDTPIHVATQLREQGFGDSPLIVLSDLDSANEGRLDGTARDWSSQAPSVLHVVAVDCRRSPTAPRLALSAGLDDASFVHPGDLGRAGRALLHALLAPEPGDYLWQIGGANGATALEWLRTDRRTRATIVDPDPGVVAGVHADATRLGVGRLEAVVGHAPGALRALAAPDAILICAGLSAHGLIPVCWQCLRPGGRLVAVAATVESEALLARYRRRMGGNLRRLQVSVAEPGPSATVWAPRTPLAIWDLVKPHAGAGPAPNLAHPALDPEAGTDASAGSE